MSDEGREGSAFGPFLLGLSLGAVLDFDLNADLFHDRPPGLSRTAAATMA